MTATLTNVLACAIYGLVIVVIGCWAVAAALLDAPGSRPPKPARDHESAGAFAPWKPRRHP